MDSDVDSSALPTAMLPYVRKLFGIRALHFDNAMFLFTQERLD